MCDFLAIWFSICGTVEGKKHAYVLQSLIEWFSVECRKTKTKVITLANHNGHKLEVITGSRPKARENTWE